MQARLAKVKQRKKLKGEIPDLNDEGGSKDTEGDKAQETQALVDRLADKSYEMLLGRNKKQQSVREWDIGKGKVFLKYTGCSKNVLFM